MEQPRENISPVPQPEKLPEKPSPEERLSKIPTSQLKEELQDVLPKENIPFSPARSKESFQERMTGVSQILDAVTALFQRPDFAAEDKFNIANRFGSVRKELNALFSLGKMEQEKEEVRKQINRLNELEEKYFRKAD